uniref:hypothetical protein n=1 Tax=Carnobacterium sp. TaxID=48221 RepID=UPI00344D093A
MAISTLKNLNKKAFINYKTGRKINLFEATDLEITIENENMYFKNIKTNQVHLISSLEQAEKIIKEHTKSYVGEYIEIEDREFYKENVGIKSLYRNGLYEINKKYLQ